MDTTQEFIKEFIEAMKEVQAKIAESQKLADEALTTLKDFFHDTN